MLNGLDLFSGIGGITLALAPWVRPIAYCEIDRYAQAVLLSRMSGGLPVAPIWDDIRTLRGSMLGEPVDIISGGFPCQDISLAGKGAGLGGERSGLFFEVERLVSEIRPRFVFLENVPAIRTRGASVVVGRLASLGYDCRWGVLSAFDVGAPHLRARWWLLANANSDKHRNQLRDLSEKDGSKRQPKKRDENTPFKLGDASSDAKVLAIPDGAGLSVKRDRWGAAWWELEPDVGRVANGISCRVDRIKGLGNAVVPAQAREAFQRLMGIGEFLIEDHR